jgi:hypothetical protein
LRLGDAVEDRRRDIIRTLLHFDGDVRKTPATFTSSAVLPAVAITDIIWG